MQRARWMQTGAHEIVHRAHDAYAYTCTRWTPKPGSPAHRAWWTAHAASPCTPTCPSVARSFVVVGRKGKPLGAAEADQKALSADQKKKKKKKKGSAEAPDFYHFQQHERKRSQLLKLREQFEQDKSKIAKMREARAFKPY